MLLKEIIVIDDGFWDVMGLIVYWFGVWVIEMSGVGVVLVFNLGIVVSDIELIVYFDVDDKMFFEKLLI